MGLFEQFPYSNMQNLNLDWILQTIKKLDQALQDDFNSYIQKWIDDHYNELFFEASYNPETETITFRKEVQ